MFVKFRGIATILLHNTRKRFAKISLKKKKKEFRKKYFVLNFIYLWFGINAIIY